MEIHYKNEKYKLVLGALILAVGMYPVYDKGLTFLDYEGFEPSLFLNLGIGLFLLIEYFKFNKIELTENCLISQGIINKKVEYKDIQGASKFNGRLRIKTDNLSSFTILLSETHNPEEIENFIFEQKQIKKLPFYKPITFIRLAYFLLSLYCLVFMVFLISGKKNEFKYFLPLKHVAVTEIEGITSKKTLAAVGMDSKGELHLSLGYVHLTEFPVNDFIHYKSKNELINAEMNFGEGLTTIEKGTKVSLKIRTSEYKRLIAGKAPAGTIVLYGMAIGNEIMFEKKWLK